jgi:hypothetical protein
MPRHDCPPRTPRRFSRRRILAGGTALTAIGAIALVSHGHAPMPEVFAAATPGTLDDDLRVSTAGWTTDFTKPSVSLSEISSGGPPRDGIPPIDHPAYVPLAEADGWLEAEEPVIAVVRGGQVRAYPLQILVWHEIVNDVLGGEPTLVTFCPLCNTAIAFDRRLDPGGPVYDFGTTGNLRFSDLVMWDRQTESWWQQLTGEAIVGELTGRVLPPYPAQILGWSAFKAAYPAGDVLSRETGFSRPYGQNPYVGYDDVDSSPFLYDGPADGRLRPMERVVGVAVGDQAVAYPLTALAGPRVANDELGGQPVAILDAPGARSVVDQAAIADSRDVGQVGVFDRRLDNRALTFAARGEDHFADAETGSTWDVTGRAVDGPLVDRQLAPLPHVVVFWFAWAAAYPQVRIWTPG